MSYRVDRNRGYEPWAVVNPWVFADYGQPQRLRGQVSPLVYKTHGPYLLSSHLGQAPDTTVSPSEARARRMELIAMASLGASFVSLYMFWRHVASPQMQKNSAATRPPSRRKRKKTPAQRRKEAAAQRAWARRQRKIWGPDWRQFTDVL